MKNRWYRSKTIKDVPNLTIIQEHRFDGREIVVTDAYEYIPSDDKCEIAHKTISNEGCRIKRKNLSDVHLKTYFE